jgi:hypothetical protein
MPSKRRPGAPADIEELRPDLFVVHNPAAGPTLRGEGEREGDRFRLTTWRRDGLIARLRARGFAVLTLADQIAALPGLPPAAPLGPPLPRSFASAERVSVFGGDPPGWRPAPPAPGEPDAPLIGEGQVIRRRKGRGPASYALVARGGLRPLGEDEALRHGYAELSLGLPAPIELQPGEQGPLLPDLPLPAAHRSLLGRFAARTGDGWLISAGAVELAAALLARLGLRLHDRATEPTGPGE